MSMPSWSFLVVWCRRHTSKPQKKKITLIEQTKWALFLKSFFEISEAIPWPRDHILFTFPLPTTQAMLAKFTKEDPHWKIQLIPDWKFMCWLRWISSGRFSQERGVKKKKRKQNWDPFWLKSGLSVSGRKAKLLSACQLPFMLKAVVGSLFSPWRERLCRLLQKCLGLDDCFKGRCRAWQSRLMLLHLM